MKNKFIYSSVSYIAFILFSTSVFASNNLPDCNAYFTTVVDGSSVHLTSFTTPGPGDVTSYAWSFGDGTYGDAANPNHEYAEPGAYSICLEVTFASGCTHYYCDSIIIPEGGGGACEASFDYTIDGTTVSFTSSSTPGPGDVTSYYWSFGDSTYGDGANPNHEYAEPGTYYVCLQIAFATGCVAYYCDTITIEDATTCEASFDYTTDGTTVSFTSSTTPGPGDVTSYYWSFGDGTYGDGANPNHEYSEPGAYSVCVQVTFASGCITYYCDSIIIPEGGGGDCATSFDYTIDATTVSFTSSSTPGPGDVISYAWNFGDGHISDDANPNHEYAEPGSYAVCLTVTFNTGCVAEFCDTTIVGEGTCNANFEYSADGLSVHFFSTSTGSSDITAIIWNFGDGDEGTGADPVHSYTEAGTYIVCLTIYTADGCTDEICYEVTVTDAEECNANFEFTADSLSVHFFSTSTGGGSDIISYAWSFGDGTYSDGINPEHTYSEPGTYNVCLEIHTADGCVSTFCYEITVEETGATCNAYFSTTSIEPDSSGWMVHFNNESTVSGGDYGTTTWYFGDGTTATSYDAEHFYAEPGTYNVCVVVTSADGSCVDEYCSEVVIGSDTECTASFGYTVDSSTVDFISTSDGGGSDILYYIWSFGDGTYGDGSDPSHTYSEPGTYEVCLTIYSADSCYDSYCETITIESAGTDCNAYFTAGDITEGEDGWTVHFNNESSGSYEYVLWSFGDGTYSDAINPEHTYSEPGTYTVCVYVGSVDSLCYDSYCQEIVIEADDPCIDESVIDTTFECSEVYEPVCGCNGETYLNACVAYYQHGVLFWTEGACTTAITDPDKSIAFTIFPNPAKDNVTITYSLTTSGDIQIQIADITGKKVLEAFNGNAAGGNQSITLNTYTLTSGIYFITINQGEISTTEKLVILK